MADSFQLKAALRQDSGKGASRRLRRESDLVPAILYGAGKDPQSLSIPHKDLYKSCEDEAFFSRIIALEVEGKKQDAIVKDLQRHPSKDRILHIDFFRVQMDQEIIVEVPLHFLNEDACVGVKKGGGNITHPMTSVEISCLPGLLPEFIEVDIANLEVGSSIHMSELNLAEGLTIPVLAQGVDYDQVVVACNVMRRTEDVETADMDQPGDDTQSSQTGSAESGPSEDGDIEKD